MLFYLGYAAVGIIIISVVIAVFIGLCQAPVGVAGGAIGAVRVSGLGQAAGGVIVKAEVIAGIAG